MLQMLDQILSVAKRINASDVHLKVGLPPVYRIRGELLTVRELPPVKQGILDAFIEEATTERQRNEYHEFHECDLAYSTAGGIRFRANLFQQRGTPGLVLRMIPPEVPSFETLNLPDVVLELAGRARGLVLVTGITGSGKSTTLASMVDNINRNRASHIVTIEDPIEFLMKDRRSVVNQRELGLDTTTFSRALRAALRQDPDVILVGEMRDIETIQIAMTAAETGHLVLSTLHTTDAVETVTRIVSVFPKDHQAQIRLQLAAVLRGVVSQRLLPKADGQGMVPAVEVLVGTARVKELIEDPTRTIELRQAIAEGRNPYGMISFDACLTDLVQERLVTYDVALRNATNPDDFALFFRGVGQSTTADEWLDQDT